MSGGSFNYMCYSIQDNYGGRLEDPVMEALLEDLCKVLRDLEWETSGDYGTGAYRRSVEQFKAKWIGRPAPILRDVIIQEMKLIQERLLTAVAWTDDGGGKE